MVNALRSFAILTAIALNPIQPIDVSPPQEIFIYEEIPIDIVEEIRYDDIVNDELLVEENIDYSIDNTDEYVIEYSGDFQEMPPYDMSEMFVPYQLIALVDDESDAYRIADKYGLELIDFKYGVAVYDTLGIDPTEFVKYNYEGAVVPEGETVFTLNYIRKAIDPVEEVLPIFDFNLLTEEP